MRLHALLWLFRCLAASALGATMLAGFADAKTVRVVPGVAGAPALPRPFPQRAPAFVPDATISIMTEALSATAGSDEDSIGELARAFAAAGLARILPVRGLGPIANMRDLLHMRGIDMAVVNADILAYARASGDLRGVDTRLSAVAKLYDKTVYLVAAAGVNGIGDLANQRVLAPGADSDSFVTARALFGELAIPVDLAGLPLGQALGEIASGKAKALLLTLEQNDETLATLPLDKGLHILPIPEGPALARIYGRRTVSPENTSGLAPEAGVSTVTVSSLLVSFNWRPTHARFAPVLQFVRALPKVVEQLRTSDATGVWQSLDGRADVPGWLRYEPARAVLASLVPVQTPLTAPQTAKAAPVAKAPATSSALAPAAVAVSPAVAAPEPAPVPVAPAGATIAVEVAAHAMAVLTSEKDAKGGLLAEIVNSALKADVNGIQWLPDDRATLAWLINGASARIGLPFAKPDCDHTQDLSLDDTALCAHFVFSKPIFQSLQVFFVRHGSDFTFERDDQLVGRSVCAPEHADLASLDAPSRHWLKDDLITLLQRPNLKACFQALDHGDVDAVFADDLGGRAALEEISLSDKIEVARRPVATFEICAIAARDNADGVAALKRLDTGVAALKADGRYADIVLGRLAKQQLSGDVPAVQ